MALIAVAICLKTAYLISKTFQKDPTAQYMDIEHIQYTDPLYSITVVIPCQTMIKTCYKGKHQHV